MMWRVTSRALHNCSIATAVWVSHALLCDTAQINAAAFFHFCHLTHAGHGASFRRCAVACMYHPVFWIRLCSGSFIMLSVFYTCARTHSVQPTGTSIHSLFCWFFHSFKQETRAKSIYVYSRGRGVGRRFESFGADVHLGYEDS